MNLSKKPLNLSNFIEIFRNSLSPGATTRFAIIHARALNGASANAGKYGPNPSVGKGC